MYRMPKRRRRTAKKSLLFQVPLIRVVLPLDSSDGKIRPSSADTSSSLQSRTILRIIRIVTPLEDVLRAKFSDRRDLTD